ncbi:zinc finger protein CONSTANS-LIKE 16-like [Canna indica]|uniref:Zinc finger protein CONSTANS-LIKE 16-like n=1 Tax=Canna indica TaxID=4628 RepID=A0AAQ3KID6_9LILI|nr:zinc finger protein CONSTANS-LIKE 16-like [Canna indica]
MSYCETQRSASVVMAQAENASTRKPGSIETIVSPAKVESLVPHLEVLSAEDNHHMEEEEEEEEEQLIYCVPILDPVLAEFCSHPEPLDNANASGDEVKPPLEQLALDCPHVPVLLL